MVRAPRFTRAAALLLVCLLLPALSGCGGGDLVGADADLAFLVGDWDATRFVVQSKADPKVAPELIGGLSARFWLNVQPSGQYTATLIYQARSLTEIGLLEVDGGDLIFHVSFPEPPEATRSRFTTSGPGRLTLVGDTEFEFVLGAGPQPATTTIDLEKR